MKKLEKLLIYQKAMNLCTAVHSLMLAIPEDDEYLQATKGFMVEDAMIMASKIAGAEGGDLYSIRMQNAAIIRDHAMHLYVQVGSLRFHKSFKDIEYVTLLRDDIEEFRLLFIDWVASFDKSNHMWDEWELFNPEGAVRPIESENEDFDIDDFLNFDDDEDDDEDDDAF